MLNALLQRFCYSKYTKNGFHVTISILQCSFKIFVNLFAFLYVKANPNEICDQISFPSLFRKKVSALIFEIQNFLEKLRCYPNFPLWIPKALTKI